MFPEGRLDCCPGQFVSRWQFLEATLSACKKLGNCCFLILLELVPICRKNDLIKSSEFLLSLSPWNGAMCSLAISLLVDSCVSRVSVDFAGDVEGVISKGMSASELLSSSKLDRSDKLELGHEMMNWLSVDGVSCGDMLV